MQVRLNEAGHVVPDVLDGLVLRAQNWLMYVVERRHEIALHAGAFSAGWEAHI